MENENSGFFRNYCSQWPESLYEQTSNWIYEGMWVLKVKVISWPWPKVVYIQKFKPDYLRNYCANLNQFFMSAFRYNEMKIWWHNAGHMIKMATTPVYCKNPSKFFSSGTGGPISTKLGMKHRGLQPIIVCSNDDPRVTLSYFTARSNLVT